MQAYSSRPRPRNDDIKYTRCSKKTQRDISLTRAETYVNSYAIMPEALSNVEFCQSVSPSDATIAQKRSILGLRTTVTTEHYGIRKLHAIKSNPWSAWAYTAIASGRTA